MSGTWFHVVLFVSVDCTETLLKTTKSMYIFSQTIAYLAFADLFFSAHGQSLAVDVCMARHSEGYFFVFLLTRQRFDCRNVRRISKKKY